MTTVGAEVVSVHFFVFLLTNDKTIGRSLSTRHDNYLEVIIARFTHQYFLISIVFHDIHWHWVIQQLQLRLHSRLNPVIKLKEERIYFLCLSCSLKLLVTLTRQHSICCTIWGLLVGRLATVQFWDKSVYIVHTRGISWNNSRYRICWDKTGTSIHIQSRWISNLVCQDSFLASLDHRHLRSTVPPLSPLAWPRQAHSCISAASQPFACSSVTDTDRPPKRGLPLLIRHNH